MKTAEENKKEQKKTANEQQIQRVHLRKGNYRGGNV
jgi:hypothetical protein